MKLGIMKPLFKGEQPAAAKAASVQLHFHHLVNMPFWAVIPKCLYPATAGSICPLPAWHAPRSSRLHIPISVLIRISTQSERETELREAGKALTENSSNQAGAISVLPFPSTLPLHLQFAVRAPRKMKASVWSCKADAM